MVRKYNPLYPLKEQSDEDFPPGCPFADEDTKDEIEEASLEETCPEGSKPKGGKCAKADNSGYLKGKCDVGFIPNKNDDTKCEKMPK